MRPWSTHTHTQPPQMLEFTCINKIHERINDEDGDSSRLSKRQSQREIKMKLCCDARHCFLSEQVFVFFFLYVVVVVAVGKCEFGRKSMTKTFTQRCYARTVDPEKATTTRTKTKRKWNFKWNNIIFVPNVNLCARLRIRLCGYGYMGDCGDIDVDVFSVCVTSLHFLTMACPVVGWDVTEWCGSPNKNKSVFNMQTLLFLRNNSVGDERKFELNGRRRRRRREGMWDRDPVYLAITFVFVPTIHPREKRNLLFSLSFSKSMRTDSDSCVPSQ